MSAQQAHHVVIYERLSGFTAGSSVLPSTAPAEVPAATAGGDVYAAYADREDEDGDMMMAEEEADQLVSSLQAARHDSNEWVTPTDHPSIAMLLYGQQVSATYSLYVSLLKMPAWCNSLVMCILTISFSTLTFQPGSQISQGLFSCQL